MNIFAGRAPSTQSLKVFQSMFLFFIHCLNGKLCLALASVERSMGVPLFTPMLADTTVRKTFCLVSLKPAFIWAGESRLSQIMSSGAGNLKICQHLLDDVDPMQCEYVKE